MCVCGYHADVSVYVEDAFIGALLVEFGQDELLHPKHNAVLTANCDGRATTTHRQTGSSVNNNVCTCVSPLPVNRTVVSVSAYTRCCGPSETCCERTPQLHRSI